MTSIREKPTSSDPFERRAIICALLTALAMTVIAFINFFLTVKFDLVHAVSFTLGAPGLGAALVAPVWLVAAFFIGPVHWFNESRRALWKLLSESEAQQRIGARELMRCLGSEAERFTEAVRGSEAHISEEAIQAMRELGAHGLRSRLERQGPVFVAASSIVGAFMAFSMTQRQFPGLNELAGQLVCAWVFPGAIFVLVTLSLLFRDPTDIHRRRILLRPFARHRERELIWQLNSSEPAEKIDAARELAVWGSTGALGELFEAEHDDDPGVARAAARAATIIRLLSDVSRRRPNAIPPLKT